MKLILSTDDSKVHKVSGDVTLNGSIKATDNTINISADTSALYDNKWTRYLKGLEDGTINLPYVSSVSTVTPDVWNNIWVLGGKTTQVDPGDARGELTVCDMAPTIDYPRIYSSVYAMLRQLRLWIDANKDSLLLYSTDADAQWDKMLTDDGDNSWSFSESDSTTIVLKADNSGSSSRSDSTITVPKVCTHMYRENRGRSDISVIPPAASLLGEYVGTVALWNHAVGLPDSSINVRLHPADQSGIYVGINVVVPMTEQKQTDIVVTATITLNGQSGEGLHLWLRVPKASVTPAVSTTTTVEMPISDLDISSSESSRLDDGSATVKSNTADVTITSTIAADDVRSQQILQCVVEAIPFFMCSPQESYPDSKKGERYPVNGENTWTITVDVQKDGVSIQKITETKHSAYASVCDDPDASVSS